MDELKCVINSFLQELTQIVEENKQLKEENEQLRKKLQKERGKNDALHELIKFIETFIDRVTFFSQLKMKELESEAKDLKNLNFIQKRKDTIKYTI